MSTLKVDTITDSNGGNTAVLNGVVNAPGSMNFRNRIINGDMRIDQRNNGASVVVARGGAGTHIVDRFAVQIGSSTDEITISATRSADAPIGFTNSLLSTITTAEAAWIDSELAGVRHVVEGTNVSDLGWGTANARSVTLSFWVKSSVAGTLGGALRNGAQVRSYPFTYAVSAANTWEYKTIVIPGDTAGIWATDNTAGVQIYFALGAGPDRAGAAGSWQDPVSGQTSSPIAATGQVMVGSTTGATFYITGVQLEAGSVATPFERRPYGTELALCQRYYYRINSIGGNDSFYSSHNTTATTADGVAIFPSAMRIAPTAMEQTGAAADYSVFTTNTSVACSSVPTYRSANTNTARLRFTVASGLTAGQGSQLLGATSNAFLAWSAEL